MVEILKHIFGICGDGHPSIIYGIGILPVLLSFKNRIILGARILLQRCGLGPRQGKI